ncbi:subtilisin-like serine protease QhpE [Zestomonas thermotolerans]|uniref:subtilisin-like serine protease QhpE n=1 Tax=Zestomonas thermotolerans TaxID=157784 RepID=UPI00037007B9|nr:S8/S53 family peptidase [Pseudomonas thermotolerans]
MRPRVGIIDSGVSESLYSYVLESRRFSELPGDDPAQPDSLGHGDRLARLILAHCPEAELLIAQVFHGDNRAPVARIAAALDWLVARGAQIVNLSFGLARPSQRLTEACQRAARRGVLLVASAPACGGPVYPAALPECLAVTGDARCAAGELAWLGQPHAELGACPMIAPGRPEQGGGSSFACARVSGMAARLLAREGRLPVQLPEALRHSAQYLGPEVLRA